MECAEGPKNDLALLKLPPNGLDVTAVEFASPLRHGGKHYSVLGFPGGDPQGRNATGVLNAMDARGLVQMDRGGALSVLGGFSGAPVWSADVAAFVGLVVREHSSAGVSWCIPSRRVCEFFPRLHVRFRIPPSDRPRIHDREVDEPNLQLFGTRSENSQYRLSASVHTVEDEEEGEYFVATATYKCTRHAQPRGGYVTFITYPDFEQDGEDAYELFALVQGRSATVEFYPGESFVLAAIGDGGDTALTFDLAKAEPRPEDFF